MKTGEKYKDDEEWKAKGIPESDIRKDVRVIMPSLDLFGKQNKNRYDGHNKSTTSKTNVTNGGMSSNL